MSDTPKNKDLTEFIAILGTLVIIFCIWASYPRILTAMDEPTPPPKVTIPYKATEPEQTANTDKTKFENVGEKYGTYGDSYGSLNTLFSGLAFAVLIISLFMQRQELKAQREELAAQRGELTAQRKEAEQSNKIAEEQRIITAQQATLIKQQIDEAKVQNFYFVLFKYFENLDSTISKIKVKAKFGSNQLQGLDLFKHFSHEFLSSLPKMDLDITNDNIYQIVKKDIKTSYIYATSSYNIKLEESLFLENILMILRYIEKNENLIDVRQAIQIFLAHVNIDTLLCLAWISILGEWELKRFIEKYSLLRHIEKREEPDDRLKNIKPHFEVNAFMPLNFNS